MVVDKVRDFSKRGDAIPVPTLTRVQAEAYRRFLQLEIDPMKRDRLLGRASRCNTWVVSP